MSTLAGLMTVQQFRGLDDPPGAYYELHHGEIVEASRPKWKHSTVQWRLRDLLNSIAGERGRSQDEFPFRALPEYELRVADVAFVSAGRYRSVPAEDNLQGSPELVVEVLSPSNTRREITEKAALCLNTGSLEFWVIDPDLKLVTVYSAGERIEYRSPQAVPVDRFLPGQSALSVADLFSNDF